VRIERLTLAGFKSFGDRTTVEFAPGVTAIVGPNGSGKSNVLDALRWATGGGRAREFRAGEKTDLIFHGAAGKKRLGRAEVEVELTAGEKRLRIRRSLDRDGVTKLTLNGRVARFLDLDEELAGSGLGRGSLAVIGQGEVSGVLMADPSRLLSYVSEAAGVARLSGRREQTEARLETARGHLDRLEEKLAEDAERIAALRRDADDAHRYDEGTAEARRLRLTIAEARVASLRGEVASLREEAARLEAALLDGRQEMTTLRETVEAARVADAEAEADYREATAAYARATAEVRVAEHALEAATTRAADLERQRERTRAERDGLRAQPAPAAPSDDLEALEARAVRARRSWDAARAARERAEADAEAARAARERLEDEAARAARDAAEAAARRDGLEGQLEDVEARLAQAADRGDERAPAGEGDDAEAGERAADVALGRAESALEEIRSRLERAQARLADAAAEARARERDRDRQRAAFETRRGYAEGPRHALASGVPGVIGSLADVLRVPRELEEAIATALGRRAEYVLTEDADGARRVLRHVREAGGWVTLLPLELVRGEPPGIEAALLEEPGVVARASDRVACAPRFRPVVEQLLGGTLLVETTERATELARRYPRRPRLVSLEGDVLEPGGALSGGRRQGRSPVLGAAAELEEAERAAREAAANEATARDEVAAVQSAFREAAQERTEARDAADRARDRASRFREARAAERRLREELQARRDRLRDELASLPEPPAAVDEGALRAARDADRHAREALAGTREEETPAAQAASDAARAWELAEERQRAHQAAWARHQEDLGRADALERELERLASAVEAGWAGASQAEARASAARAALPEPPSAAERAREEAREALRDAETRLERAAAEQNRRAEGLERARVLLARRETALETALEERAGFPEGLEPLDVGERTARQRLREVEAELEAIGAVNHRAAATLAELEGEHVEREREARAAREAVERLAGTLQRLDRETTERLDAAIDGVRARFVTHVGELFGSDGEGDVEVDRDETRPVGLRIRLQPPGKRTQSLGLLSVGERTMGALAFLFALMGEERGDAGLPVAVLDEVDAPLDEANIRRYRTFLERLAARGTQFVLITHQKATFEVADVLWGVTTERGVSRVFSIRKEDDEPRAAQPSVWAEEGGPPPV
jgi:chromosome segregation protein